MPTDPTPTIQAMLDEAGRATKGPWHLSVEGFSKRPIVTVYATDDELRYLAFCDDTMNAKPTANAANGVFIVHARENVPALCRALLAAVERLQQIERTSDDLSAKALAETGIATITKHLEARDGK